MRFSSRSLAVPMTFARRVSTIMRARTPTRYPGQARLHSEGRNVQGINRLYGTLPCRSTWVRPALAPTLPTVHPVVAHSLDDRSSQGRSRDEEGCGVRVFIAGGIGAKSDRPRLNRGYRRI